MMLEANEFIFIDMRAFFLGIQMDVSTYASAWSGRLAD
jgi:hypothetical protein